MGVERTNSCICIFIIELHYLIINREEFLVHDRKEQRVSSVCLFHNLYYEMGNSSLGWIRVNLLKRINDFRSDAIVNYFKLYL